MRIFNQEKTQELVNPNLEKGYLKDDKLFVCHHEAVSEKQEQFHYETIKVYSNGGKTVKKIIDIPKVDEKEAYDEYEDIKVYIPYTFTELMEIEKNNLRKWREDCFVIIDRATWLFSLTETEKNQVAEFRRKLLDITVSLQKPVIPECVKKYLD